MENTKIQKQNRNHTSSCHPGKAAVNTRCFSKPCSLRCLGEPLPPVLGSAYSRCPINASQQAVEPDRLPRCPQPCLSSAPRAAAQSATGRRRSCRWRRWSRRSARRSAKVGRWHRARAGPRLPGGRQVHYPLTAPACPPGFAELQTDMTDLTKELNRSQGIPFLEYKHFVTRTFFPKVSLSPPLNLHRPPGATCPSAPACSTGPLEQCETYTPAHGSPAWLPCVAKGGDLVSPPTFILCSLDVCPYRNQLPAPHLLLACSPHQGS